jgi:hypothetical protein
MTKQILVIFNSSVKQVIRQRGNSAYTVIDDLYRWLLQLLACESISFVHKKVLEPAFAQVLELVLFKKERFL